MLRHVMQIENLLQEIILLARVILIHAHIHAHIIIRII